MGGHSTWNFEWKAEVPFLLVELREPTPRVMLIHRKDIEARYASLEKFGQDEAVELAKQLREQFTSGSYSSMGYGGTDGTFMVSEMKRRLELAF